MACCLLSANKLVAQEHPSLILTKTGVEEIRKKLGTVPLFDASLQKVKEEIDQEIAGGLDVPIPKDYSGGYTHERHKRNFLMMQKAGVLFQILQEEKYASYIKKMLFRYEAMYKSLPVHPKERSYARGKLFWQCLNDSNWLVYVSQAYDCIYNWLSKDERNTLEENLFKPFADYISIGNPQFFNRVHNHSTWGNAAVGMIGLVMGDEELVNRALYGINNDTIDSKAKDNDGGFIKTQGKVGFFANLEEPFSPDGYYTEGPYYQRYAMYPFLMFATGLHNVKPELAIFAHKDSVILKSVKTLVNLTNREGEFFPINDAQKGMSYQSRELTTAIDLAYYYGNKDEELLSIAKIQGRVNLDQSGFAVAKAIAKGMAKPFTKESVHFSDGSNGQQGGIAVLREKGLELVFKYTAQGLSHGHYDKLSFMLYHKGAEVLQDYGMARFVNIEQKGGGNYLKENSSWAKQTVAHNTLVVNEESHFEGNYERASKNHSEEYFFGTPNAEVQVVSAVEKNAYSGTRMHRTMAILNIEAYENPLVLDIFKVTADSLANYDLPFYFKGQLMATNFEYKTNNPLKALGAQNGYQHLFLEASGKSSSKNLKVSWLNNKVFHTLTSLTDPNDELLFTRVGAHDPEFNLRRDPGFVIRRNESSNTLFASLLETHGSYSPVTEFSVNSKSSIASLQLLLDTDAYTVISIEHQNGKQILFAIANQSAVKEEKHQLLLNNKTYHWKGPFLFTEINN